MISQAVSPSSHSVTRPRMMTGWNGLSAGARDSATRGSRRRLRALRERGPVKKINWSSWVPTKTGVLWGEPSGKTVARWPSEVPSRTRRTSGLSIFLLLSGMAGEAADVVRSGARVVVLGREAGVLRQPHAPPRRRRECVEQAEGFGAEVLDRMGQVVAARREVHDAGDLVPLPDVEEGRLVRGVQRLDDDPAAGLADQVLRQPGGPVRGEHDGFAQVEQGPCGVRPDRTQAAGNEDHPRLSPSG